VSSLKPVQLEERRRSTRIDRGVALIVKGADVFKVPYQEFALTEAINFHGCRYQTKHEVVPGEVIQLDVVHTEEGHPGRSAQARVTRVSPLEQRNQASYFDIAVELNAPGNVWGIANPPKDWLALEGSKPSDRIGLGQDVRILERSQSSGSSEVAVDAKCSPKEQEVWTTSPVSPSLVQFMAQFLDGLSAQTQMKATDAAVLAIREEKERWLGDLRAELHTEVPKMIEGVVSAAKQEFVSQAREAAEVQEAVVGANYERWTKAIREEMEDASTRLNAQRSEIVGQLETIAATTIERMQRNARESWQQVLEDSASRLRSEIVPLIEEANATMESVKTAEEGLKTNLLTASNTFQQFAQHEHERVKTELQGVTALWRQEFEGFVDNRIGTAQKELEKRTTVSIENAKEAFLQLVQTSETNAKQQFDSLIASASDEVNALQEQTREYLSKMETCSRRQLQFVSELLSRFAIPDQSSS
jgi:hypothetical protein